MSHRIAAIIAVLTLLCGIVLHPSSAQEVPVTVADSAEGLQSQIETVLEAAKNHHSKGEHDSKTFEDLISDLRIPEKSNWFASKFGDDLGAKLVLEYGRSWDSFQDTLTRSFLGAVASKPKQTLVTLFGSSSPFAQANMTSIQQGAESSLTLYEITLLTGRGKDSVPGLYVYADGAFRVLNWATLYQVPNVKAGRIRIAGNVQQAKLVHQVNPTPTSDAFKNHVQGTVQLHVVIGVEGNVKQVDVLSGPPDLAAAATDAVKQWRYQPTLLNGDPVEVDTTVSVSFVLGG
ncbi:MAG TPA: energy transducer TonB [Candidatus Acidoferrales bacterium]|nr:energy transducer TonB [Candidatus Acidoferrales bacterium]